MPGMENHPDLFDLRMSEEVRPLYDQVVEFIEKEVKPITNEFFRLGEGREDRWSWAPGQLELLDGVKEKAKTAGLWNFFLPDAETGEGLSNLDYAYIAAELGKNPIASRVPELLGPRHRETWKCSSASGPRAEREVAEPLLNGEIRSAYAMTEPDVASLRRQERAPAAPSSVGDEWVINGEKYYISGAGDPRCKIMIVMVQTNPDGPPHQRQSQILVPTRRRPASRSSARCTCSAKDDAPHGHMHLRFNDCRVPKENILLGRGPRLRDLPGAPRARPNPPLHALDRRGREGHRADGQARPHPRGLRQESGARWARTPR